MKVLITGGAGFIGSHLAEHWVKEGATVVVLDSLRTGSTENLEGIDCTFVEGSVEDLDTVRSCMEDVDFVFHLAALVSVTESMQNPELTEQINTLGTLNVLRAAREWQVMKVVFASSCAVYGEIERPVHRETDMLEPMSPYAISKMTGEQYMRLYNDAFTLPTASLRFFNVYGPRQDPTSPYSAVVAKFTDLARKNEPLTIYDDGEQTRDFVFVEDIVAACAMVAEKGTGVYNVACGGRITVNDLAQEIIRLSGSQSEIKHLDARAGDIRHSRGHNERLMELGWHPKVELEKGLRRTLGSHSESTTHAET